MDDAKEAKKVEGKVLDALSIVLNLPLIEVVPELRYFDLISADFGALRELTGEIERSVKITMSDTLLSKHPTVGELVEYCVRNKRIARRERGYVVLVRMPDGRMCERHYSASGHEQAMQKAREDGASEIVDVMREDSEDGRFRWKVRAVVLKVLLPLIFALVAALSLIAYVM